MPFRSLWYVILAAGLLVLTPSAEAQVRVDNCRRGTDGHITCTVEEADPLAIGPLHVDNYSKVAINIIEKSPFDTCVLADVKLEEIKTQDPIAAIVQLLAKSATGISFPDKGPSAASMIVAVRGHQNPVVNTPELKLLYDITLLNDFIENKRTESVNSAKELKDAGADAAGLFDDPPRSADEYNRFVNPTVQWLNAILSEPEPSSESEQVQYTILHDRVKAYLTSPPDDSKDSDDTKKKRADTVQEIEVALNNAAGNLDALKASYDMIKAARAEFAKLVAFLDQAKFKTPGAYQAELFLVPNVQTKASTSFSCTNGYTKKVAPSQVPITVLFEGEPHLSVSVGPLLSFVPKRKLGTTQVKTGTDSNGVSTFKTVLAVVDSAPVQIVPLAFLNYRITTLYRPPNPLNRKSVTLHASLGVGVNPNSGSNEVEFFVGPAVAYKNYLFQFGDHIGRYQDGFTGGFQIGDTVPSNFPSSLPIHRVYRHGFGLALSYRLPI
jgi:hypothetical protein